jgi:hypothetical protein
MREVRLAIMVTDAKTTRSTKMCTRRSFEPGHELQGIAVISRDITAQRKSEESKAAYQRGAAGGATIYCAESSNHNLVLTSMEMLCNLLESGYHYTAGHSKRVCEIAVSSTKRVWGNEVLL